jgi:drug/metabolite transporter (DMT)-like permease
LFDVVNSRLIASLAERIIAVEKALPDSKLNAPSSNLSTSAADRLAYLAKLKVLVAVCIWGTSFVTTKIIVDQIDPVALVPVRTFGGALILFLILKRRGQWTGLAHGRLLANLAVLGFVGVAVHLTIQAIGLSLTSASNTGWMVSLSPIFIGLLAWKFLGESFGGLQLVGFLVAMSGALLVVMAQAGGFDIFTLPSTLGDGLAFASAITWAVFSVLSKRIIKQGTPAVLMVQVMALGCLMTLPLFVARQGWYELASLDGAGWLALGFTILFVASFGYLFWYDALSHLDASKVGVFLYIEPLVTVGLAAVLLGEPLRPLALLGGAAILFGVWLV